MNIILSPASSMFRTSCPSVTIICAMLRSRLPRSLNQRLLVTSRATAITRQIECRNINSECRVVVLRQFNSTENLLSMFCTFQLDESGTLFRSHFCFPLCQRHDSPPLKSIMQFKSFYINALNYHWIMIILNGIAPTFR
jgi:hypothetical protein